LNYPNFRAKGVGINLSAARGAARAESPMRDASHAHVTPAKRARYQYASCQLSADEKTPGIR
jgi:hypothetical protein